jgi:hypothetical protein
MYVCMYIYALKVLTLYFDSIYSSQPLNPMSYLYNPPIIYYKPNWLAYYS